MDIKKGMICRIIPGTIYVTRAGEVTWIGVYMREGLRPGMEVVVSELYPQNDIFCEE